MEYQSVLIDDILSVDATSKSPKDVLESHRAGINMLIRASVTEVTNISPGKLTEIIRGSVYKVMDLMVRRAHAYVEKRTAKHHELTPAMTKEMQDRFARFSRELKHAFDDATLAIENHILSSTYMLDHELYTAGYIRFAHQEGIDYTDLAGAKQLGAEVWKEEAQLEAQLRELAAIKAELLEIDAVLPAVDRLMAWLDQALVSGLSQAAPQISRLMAELEAVVERIHAA